MSTSTTIPDLPTNGVKIVSDYVVIPTTETGLARIEAVIDKINNLDIEPLLAKFTEAAEEASKTMQDIQASIGGADKVIAETKLTMEQSKGNDDRSERHHERSRHQGSPRGNPHFACRN